MANTLFKVLSTALLLPMSGLLEKLVVWLIPETGKDEEEPEIDERLLATPSLALSHCRGKAMELAKEAERALEDSISALTANFRGRTGKDKPEKLEVLAKRIHRSEERTDQLEDALDSYLVQLSAREISEEDNEWISALLKITGDYERIADHSVNLLEAAQRMERAKLSYTEEAQMELETITAAVEEVMLLSLRAFENQDSTTAYNVEPLEEVVDQLKKDLRNNHIKRMKTGKCSMEAGIIWADILTDLERISDHCSNVAGCILDMQDHTMSIHENLRYQKNYDPGFKEMFAHYQDKYRLVSGRE